MYIPSNLEASFDYRYRRWIRGTEFARVWVLTGFDHVYLVLMKHSDEIQRHFDDQRLIYRDLFRLPHKWFVIWR